MPLTNDIALPDPPARATLGQLLRAEVFARQAALWAMIAMSSLYLWAMFQRVAVPGTIFNELQTSLHLGARQVTSLGAADLYIYATMQVFVGYFADRFGGVRVLLFGGSFLTLGAILFPLSDALPMLYASRVIVGFGASFVFLGCAKELDTLFGDKGFSLLIGPLMVFGSVGALLATSPCELAVRTLGWRHALLGVGIGTGLTVLTILILLRRLKISRAKPPVHPGATEHPIFGHVRAVIFSKAPLPGSIASMAQFVGYFLLSATLGKKVLQDCAHLSSQAAAATLFLMILCQLLVMFTSGVIARLYHDRRVPMALTCTSLIGIGYVLLLIAVQLRLPPWLYVFAFLLVGAANGLSPVFNFSLKEITRPQAYGFALGWFNSMAYIAVALVVFLAGFVLDHYRSQALVTDAATIYPPSCYVMLFGIMLALQVVGSIAALMVPETHGKLRYASL